MVLIDELYDSGTTLNAVIEDLSDRIDTGHITIVTLFKKERSQNQHQQPDFYGVLVPDVWLVGYGLDDRQEKRGWPVVYACPKATELEKTVDDALFDNDAVYLEHVIAIMAQTRPVE